MFRASLVHEVSCFMLRFAQRVRHQRQQTRAFSGFNSRLEILAAMPKRKRECLLEIEDIEKASVKARPSRVIKSPYLADVELADGSVVLCHTPSLGCCGMISPGATIMVAKASSKASTRKSEYAAYCVETTEEEDGTVHYVGVHPQVANTLVYTLLRDNFVKRAEELESIGKEIKLGGSRFDFVGTTRKGHQVVIEVKSVPLAHYYDLSPRERKKFKLNGEKVMEKLAYFPEGYRKKAGEVVSPRALKHVQDLSALKKEHGDSITCILLFLVQRSDCNRFTVTKHDALYREAVLEARNNGVVIEALSILWQQGKAYYHKQLEIVW